MTADTSRLRTEIEEAINRCFVSRDEPLYHFKPAAIDVRPYDALLRDLRRIADAVDDDTHFEESVCYRWSLRSSEDAICLWLSLVGRFAMVHEGPWSAAGRNLEPSEMGTPLRAKAAEALARHSVVHLPHRLVTATTHFTIPNDPESRGTEPLYRVLFDENLELPSGGTRCESGGPKS